MEFHQSCEKKIA